MTDPEASPKNNKVIYGYATVPAAAFSAEPFQQHCFQELFIKKKKKACSKALNRINKL